MRRAKKLKAIIKNDKGEICHRINDVLTIALARNESLTDTKEYIIENYKDYKVEFVIRESKQ